MRNVRVGVNQRRTERVRFLRRACNELERTGLTSFQCVFFQYLSDFSVPFRVRGSFRVKQVVFTVFRLKNQCCADWSEENRLFSAFYLFGSHGWLSDESVDTTSGPLPLNRPRPITSRQAKEKRPFRVPWRLRLRGIRGRDVSWQSHTSTVSLRGRDPPNAIPKSVWIIDDNRNIISTNIASLPISRKIIHWRLSS